MAQNLTGNTAVLKGVVILLGVVFLALLGIFVYAVFSSYGAGPVDARFAPAPGEELVGVAGVGNRLALHLRRADGSTRIVYVDPQSGKAAGELVIEAAP